MRAWILDMLPGYTVTCFSVDSVAVVDQQAVSPTVYLNSFDTQWTAATQTQHWETQSTCNAASQHRPSTRPLQWTRLFVVYSPHSTGTERCQRHATWQPSSDRHQLAAKQMQRQATMWLVTMWLVSIKTKAVSAIGTDEKGRGPSRRINKDDRTTHKEWLSAPGPN